MKHLLRLAPYAVFVYAATAQAIPSAANSRIPSHILLVGRHADLADTASGAFTVVVHDGANVPVPNSTVEVRILNCPGARLSSQSYVPGISIRCGTQGVQGTTDANGEIRMTLVGGGLADGPPGTGPCAQIFASNVLLGIASLAYLDLDASSGMGANDVALWLRDAGLQEPIGRSDFDGDGQLTANDLTVWLMIWGATRSAESAATYCP